jgi:hypothetical protein
LTDEDEGGFHKTGLYCNIHVARKGKINLVVLGRGIKLTDVMHPHPQPFPRKGKGVPSPAGRGLG